MNTTYRVSNSQGQVIGIYPKGHMGEIKALVLANPGATVTPVVTYTACPRHPAFEPDNCPGCGTAAIMGN